MRIKSVQNITLYDDFGVKTQGRKFNLMEFQLGEKFFCLYKDVNSIQRNSN